MNGYRQTGSLIPEDNSFGAVRLAAALAVAVSHAVEITVGNVSWDYVHQITGYTLGQHAVHVFFILSGFLVTASLMRTSDLTRFAVARVMRIFPGLIVCAIFTVAVLGPLITVCPLSSYFADTGLVRYVAETTLLITGRAELPGVFTTNPLAGQINNSVWTLKYEVLCYAGLGLAFAAGVLRTSLRAQAWLWLAISVLAASYVVPGLIEAKTGPDVVRRFGLCFAMGSAAFFARHYAGRASLVVISLGALLALWSTPMKVPAMVCFEASVVFWLANLRRPALASFTMKHDFSYGIYLYGWPVSQALVQVWTAATPVEVAALTLLILVPIAAASWHLVEQPAQRLGHKLATARPVHAWSRRGAGWQQSRPQQP
ncbi:MAG: acyltransferase [Hyphomicrobium sp.]|jgi:peptidoglycan/LPS O-acetylase OafA/YrhL|uniref:acyltransferase family protein n=1 Tax=Hyphomicrobium sp. DMF-1 TaxID=3019544 RepID=UPI001AC5E3C5|nr:acyltransferase [Hyphomicrobium sp. DMF-1]MBN8911095.1 acyltransferase [Hyphomicrobiales bacterium]WBT37951.1 acyltransferase [Hyphomicrobium sp. DMF-1]